MGGENNTGEMILKRMNVSMFLRQYDSASTEKNYRVTLKGFFKLIYPSVETKYEEVRGKLGVKNIPRSDQLRILDAHSARYLDEDRDHREDFLNFKDSLKGKAPKTQSVRFNVIRTFLDDNGINFPKRFFKNLNGKATEAISHEDIPQNDELKRICEYMPVHGKAVTLALSSSGMRIGEAVQLKIEDFELDREIVKIRIPANITKTGRKRITFISPEAKDAVLEWLKFRPKYLEQARKRSKTYARGSDEGRMFPFSTGNFNGIWRNALNKAGLAKVDPKTKRLEMRPHNLRKYFRLRVGRFGRDEAEALMGHQRGLNAVYARFDGEDGENRLQEIYTKAIPELSVYEAQSYRLKDEILAKQSTFEASVANLSLENAGLKRLAEKQGEAIASLRSALSSTEKAFDATADKLISRIERLENPEPYVKDNLFKRER